MNIFAFFCVTLVLTIYVYVYVCVKTIRKYLTFFFNYKGQNSGKYTNLIFRYTKGGNSRTRILSDGLSQHAQLWLSKFPSHWRRRHSVHLSIDRFKRDRFRLDGSRQTCQDYYSRMASEHDRHHVHETEHSVSRSRTIQHN